MTPKEQGDTHTWVFARWKTALREHSRGSGVNRGRQPSMTADDAR